MNAQFRTICFSCILMMFLSALCQTVTAASGENLLETALYITNFINDGSRRFRYLEHLAATRAKIGDVEGAMEVMEHSELQEMSNCPVLGVLEQLIETGYLAEARSLLNEYNISAIKLETCLTARVPDLERAFAVALAYIDQPDRSLDILKSFEHPVEQAIGYAQVANVLKRKGQDVQAEKLFTLAAIPLTSSSRNYIFEEKLSVIVNAFAQAGKIDTALKIVDSNTLHEEDKAPYLAIIVTNASDNGDLENATKFFERMLDNIEHITGERSALLAAMAAAHNTEEQTDKEFETALTAILPTIQQETTLLKLSEVVMKLSHADDTRWADTLVKQIIKDALSLQEPSFLKKISNKLFKKAPPSRQTFLLPHVMRNLAEAGYGDEACLLFERLQKTQERYERGQLAETLVEGLVIGDDPENALLIATSQSLRDEHLWGIIAARLAGKYEFEKALDIVRTMEDWQDKTNACAYMAIQALSLTLNEQQDRQFAQHLFETYRDRTLIHAPNNSLYEVACSLAHIGENDEWNDEAQNLGKIASILVDKTQTTLAEDALERALALVENQALARTGIVEALLKMEKYERLFQEIQHTPTATKQLGKFLYPVASTAIAIGDSAGAYQALNDAMKLVSSLEEGQNKTLTLSHIAELFSQSGHITEAKTLAHTALQNISVIEAANYKIRFLGTLAKIFAKSGELSQADDLFTQAIEIARSIETLDEQASVLQEVVEQLTEAERFEQALELANSLPEIDSKAFALMLIATKLAHTGDIEKALAISDSIENRSSKENALGAISEELAKMHEFDRALKIASLHTEQWRKVSAFCRIADILSEEGGLKRAIAICERTLHGTEEVGASISSTELPIIALSFARAGDVEKALKLAQTQTHRWRKRRDVFLTLALYALSLELTEEEQKELAKRIITAYNQPTKN